MCRHRCRYNAIAADGRLDYDESGSARMHRRISRRFFLGLAGQALLAGALPARGGGPRGRIFDRSGCVPTASPTRSSTPASSP
jgi:hypothetical protein